MELARLKPVPRCIAYRYDAFAVSKQSSSAARRWCTTSPLLQVADLGACGAVAVRQCRRMKGGVLKGAAEGGAKWTILPVLQLGGSGACTKT